MIRLKSGKVIEINENYDLFFQQLLSDIIEEASSVARSKVGSFDIQPSDEYNKVLLKELMDNSIYVTHQIFELSKVNKNLSKFLVTGFLFNSAVLTIQDMDGSQSDEDETTVH